jgi:hypothetical protein
VLHINDYVMKIRNKKNHKNVEYNPQNVENILLKFNELDEYVTNLENSLKLAEQKTNRYEDVLQKYKKVFKEEIMLYNLHKSNISVLTQKVSENDLFIIEIQRQIESLLENDTDNEVDEEQLVSFRRIFSRFFHQNEIFKIRTQQKISEINEAIDQKNRQLERMNIEIDSWDRNEDISYLPSNAVPLRQACGL